MEGKGAPLYKYTAMCQGKGSGFQGVLVSRSEQSFAFWSQMWYGFQRNYETEETGPYPIHDPTLDQTSDPTLTLSMILFLTISLTSP